MFLYFGYIIGVLLLLILYRLGRTYIKYRRMKKQGVVFLEGTFIIDDIRKIRDQALRDPYKVAIGEVAAAIREKEGNTIPPLTGVRTPANCLISINTAKALEEVYVKHNKYLTKTILEQLMFSVFIRRSIIFKPSEDPEYIPQRKAVSSAFFKSKLIALTSIIKNVSLNYIKNMQEEKAEQIDVVKFSRYMQSQIFESVALGISTDKKTRWENEDGTISYIPISDACKNCFDNASARIKFPIFLLCPYLLPFALTKFCRRYKRNVKALRDVVQKIIEERRSGKSTSNFKS